MHPWSGESLGHIDDGSDKLYPSNLSFSLISYVSTFKKKMVPASLVAPRVNHFSTLSFREQSQKHKYYFFFPSGDWTLRAKRPNVSHSKKWLLVDGQLSNELSEGCDGGLQRDERMAWQRSRALIHMVRVNNSLFDVINQLCSQRGSTWDVHVRHSRRGDLGKNRVGSEARGALVLLRL